MTETVFTFETTHHALWAEDVARERGIPAEVVPAPSESPAKCDLAVRTFPDRMSELSRAFDAEGLPFGLWPPSGS